MFDFPPGCSVKLALNKTTGEHGVEVGRGGGQNIPGKRWQSFNLSLSSALLRVGLAHLCALTGVLFPRPSVLNSSMSQKLSSDLSLDSPDKIFLEKS